MWQAVLGGVHSTVCMSDFCPGTCTRLLAYCLHPLAPRRSSVLSPLRDRRMVAAAVARILSLTHVFTAPLLVLARFRVRVCGVASTVMRVTRHC